MEIRNINDCFKFRLLRKIEPNKDKSEQSLKVSLERLNQAKNAIKLGIYQFAILEAYMAMFHASRALLYREGIQEKSHYAIYIYLKEKYSDKIPINILNFLNIHRTQRHEALYGLEYQPNQEDSITAVEDAEAFVSEVKGVLEKEMKKQSKYLNR